MIHDRTGGLRHWVPRVAPAITTTTVLIAARVWGANGAEHAVGTAFLMGSFAAGAAGLGVSSALGMNGDRAITGLAFGGAVVFSMVGVAAYSDPLPLPILLWLISTVAVYAVCARYWREDMRAELGHLRALERDREQHRHGVQVEEIRAGSARAVAETTRDAVEAAQLLAAWQHRQALDVHPDLAGIDAASKILLGEEEKDRSKG